MASLATKWEKRSQPGFRNRILIVLQLVSYHVACMLNTIIMLVLLKRARLRYDILLISNAIYKAFIVVIGARCSELNTTFS